MKQALQLQTTGPASIWKRIPLVDSRWIQVMEDRISKVVETSFPCNSLRSLHETRPMKFLQECWPQDTVIMTKLRHRGQTILLDSSSKRRTGHELGKESAPSCIVMEARRRFKKMTTISCLIWRSIVSTMLALADLNHLFQSMSVLKCCQYKFRMKFWILSSLSCMSFTKPCYSHQLFPSQHKMKFRL